MTNLHVHTEYSLLSSTIRIPDLVKKAKETGHTAVCLTDTNAMYGSLRLWLEAKAAGLKAVIGCQLTAADRDSYVLLLAKNRTGYSEMNGLITMRNTAPEKFDLTAAVREKIRNCFVLTPSTRIAADLKGRIDGLSIELPLTRSSRRLAELVSFAGASSIPAVPTWPSFFLEPHEFETVRLLSAIRENRLFHSPDPETEALRKCRFPTAAEFAERAGRFGGTAGRLAAIVAGCAMDFDLDRVELPSAGRGGGFRRLVSLCWRGLNARRKAASRPHRERLAKELSVIRLLGLEGYFLTVHGIVRFARQQSVFYTGRGSAANSIVCWCLRITFVDPVRYNLTFERFLHAERKGLPDIDLDFPWNRRDAVIRHIYATHTAERTALIATHIRFHARSAIRETARVFGLSREDIGLVTKRLPWFFSSRRLSTVPAELPEFRDVDLAAPGLAHWKKILVYAEKIAGLVRHVSIHPGGMVITRRPLSTFTALERAPKGWSVTQLDMYDIEKLGLMKMDILGQRSLAVVTDAARMIGPARLPELERIAGDPETLRLIRRGESIGCFYIESPAMRQLLKKLRVSTFEELTAASSVIRPGVAESGMMQKYISFHNDPGSVTYLHPDLADLLRETHGIMIYQEDVLKVAVGIGGLSAADADTLRKSMSGKGRSLGAIERMRNRFVAGCESRGYLPSTAAELWRQIESFAGYAFCKAHSASFARISLMVAWLKVRFPAEFLSAVLSNRGGFYHPLVYVEEARRLGLPVLAPHADRADEDCLPDLPLQHENGTGKKGVRIGLSFVKGLHASTVRRIVGSRPPGGYGNVPALVRLCGLSEKEIVLLNASGALDGFGWNRRQTLLYASRFAGRPNQALFGSESVPRLAALSDWRIEEKVLNEIGIFGFSPTANPLSLVRPDRPVTGSDRMKDFVGRTATMLGIRISAKRVPAKDGRTMEFVSFLDRLGGFETFLGAGNHDRLAPLLHRSSVFYVTGRIRDDFGALTLDIASLDPVVLGRSVRPLEDAV